MTTNIEIECRSSEISGSSAGVQYIHTQWGTEASYTNMASHTAWDPSARRTCRFKSPTAAAARPGTRRPAARQLRLVESPAPSGCRFSLPDGWCVPRRARITSAPRTDGQDGRGRQAGVGPAQLRSAAPRNKLAGHGWSGATACSVWRRFGRGGLSEEQGGSLRSIVRGAQENRNIARAPREACLWFYPRVPVQDEDQSLQSFSQAGGATPR